MGLNCHACPSHSRRNTAHRHYERIVIGRGPSEDDFTDPNNPDFLKLARQECRCFIGQIAKEFGIPQRVGIAVGLITRDEEIRQNRFTDQTVQIGLSYDVENFKALKYIEKLKNNFPKKWDKKSAKLLFG